MVAKYGKRQPHIIGLDRSPFLLYSYRSEVNLAFIHIGIDRNTIANVMSVRYKTSKDLVTTEASSSDTFRHIRKIMNAFSVAAYLTSFKRTNQNE